MNDDAKKPFDPPLALWGTPAGPVQDRHNREIDECRRKRLEREARAKNALPVEPEFSPRKYTKRLGVPKDDLHGQTFTTLRVVAPARTNKAIFGWKATCSACGETTIKTAAELKRIKECPHCRLRRTVKPDAEERKEEQHHGSQEESGEENRRQEDREESGEEVSQEGFG